MRCVRLALLAVVSLLFANAALAGTKEKACKADPRGNAWGYWRQCGHAAATVDVNGATVETPSGAAVAVPFGALDEPVTVTVEATALAAPAELAAVSPVYAFGPEGTVFAKPVTVTLPVPAGVTHASIWLTKLGSTEFEAIGGTIANGFITAETPHFSLAVVGAESPVRTVNGVGKTTWISATSRQTIPNDYTASPAEAIVRDASGNLVSIPAIPGADGTFTIPDVPTGEYILHSGKQYLVTSTNAPDLGTSLGGRPDATPLDTSTYLDFALTNLAPWQAGSSLELFSTEVDDWDFDLDRRIPPLAEGQTTLAFTYDLGTVYAAKRIEGSRGDRLTFAQLVASTSPTGVPYRSMARLVQFDPFDAVPGGAVSLSGAMLDVQRANSVAVDWRASEFTAAIAADANPNAVFQGYNCGGFFGMLAQAGTAEDGFYTGNADLLLVDEYDGRDVLTGPMTYGSPANAGLAGSWGEIAYVRWNAGVFYALPGTLPVGNPGGNGIGWTTDLATLAAPVVIRPPISLPRNVRIDGQPFSADATLSATPTFTWDPPSIGSPTHYQLVVTELASNGRRTYRAGEVARIVTPNTSFTFLPGTLAPGRTWFVTLLAIDAAAGVNAPFRQVLHAKSAWISSGLLTTAP